mgnify:CR=1 FL=1
MGKFTALSLAGFVSVAAFGPALAADLLPPPPPVEAPVLAPAMDTSGWYLRGDVGVGVNQVDKLRSTFDAVDLSGAPYTPPPVQRVATSMGDSAVIDVGVGYQINNWFRADATIGYHSAFNYKTGYTYPAAGCGLGGPNIYCVDFYTAQVSALHGLINGYVDLGTWWGLTPYVGGGVGFANIRMKGLTDFGNGFGVAADSSKMNFAWALMGGMSYNVTDRLKLDMGYRYLNMGSFTSNGIICSNTVGCAQERHSFDLASHDFRLGFRYMLGDASAGPIMASAPVFAGRPGPLVRKY